MKRVITALGLAAAIVVTGALPAGAARTDVVWHMDSLPPEQGRVNGTLTVAVPGSDGTGGAYAFDGAERIRLADRPSLDPRGAAFSVTVHVLTTTVPDDKVGDFDLVRKGVAGDARYWKVELFPNADNTAAFAFCQMRGYNKHLSRFVSVRLKSKIDLADGVWHEITCARSKTGVTLAVDGKIRITNTHVVGNIHNAAPVAIGSKAKTWDDEYVGLMDEVRYVIG